MLRVAQTAQNGGRIVVQHRRRDAQKDDADVAHGILKQLRRGVDELQQRGRNESRDQPPAGPRLPPQQLPERPPLKAMLELFRIQVPKLYGL